MTTACISHAGSMNSKKSTKSQRVRRMVGRYELRPYAPTGAGCPCARGRVGAQFISARLDERSNVEYLQERRRRKICERYCLPNDKGYAILRHGEMSEWSKVPLSKSGRVQALVGSNPTLSAVSVLRHLWHIRRSLIVV